MFHSTVCAVPWGWWPAKGCLSDGSSVMKFKNTSPVTTRARPSSSIPYVDGVYLRALGR